MTKRTVWLLVDGVWHIKLTWAHGAIETMCGVTVSFAERMASDPGTPQCMRCQDIEWRRSI